MKKYLVIGGDVRSKNDGQTHYISPRILCDLYKVNPRECHLVRDVEDTPRLAGLDWSRFTLLQPREDGDYTLPKERIT